MNDFIGIRGARENNLKNLSLDIPKNKLVVMTGLSGSGKSTLAFDTLQRECQRQYMESMGMVTDFLSKPKVDSITGLSPSISVDQRLGNRNPRSTVGTVTEVFTYIRLLFAKLGERPCPECGRIIKPSFEGAAAGAENLWDGDEAGGTVFAAEEIEEASPAACPAASSSESPAPGAARSCKCPWCGTPLEELTMASFSFNKPEGACPACTGLGVVSKPDVSALLVNDRSILDGGVVSWDNALAKFYANALAAAGKYYGFEFDPDMPVGSFGEIQRDLLLYGVDSVQFKRHYPDKKPPSNAYGGRFEGVVTGMLRRYAEHERDDNSREKIERFLLRSTCPECGGMRLRKESREVVVAGRTIIGLSKMSLEELLHWIKGLNTGLGPDALIILQPILDDLSGRLGRLLDVGLDYLSMERPATSLSGGEAQRLRLAALLGSGLTGVLYVLDKPTTGLHPRDTGRLIKVLRQLRDLGNTVLVIEHDMDMIRAADYIIDIGPGARREGGCLVAAGSPGEIGGRQDSLTGLYLSGAISVGLPGGRRKHGGKNLTIIGAQEHNLKNITVCIPLGMLVAVTGVSGSGKSTLLFDILDRAARKRFFGAGDQPGRHGGISGWEHVDRVITVDQTPIGRIPRSNAATYTDAFTAIRNVFAALPGALEGRLKARHFSFNVPGGRCEKCQGAGVLTVKMHFLPEVQVRCPVCRGLRFKPEVLAVRYRGFSISDVLNMSVGEALSLFGDVAAVSGRLSVMEEVGLGYLRLGQPATTLSGGEAQRIKLAKELSKKGKGHVLYLLDEPTTGLHLHDVGRLLAVLQRLVDAGNTVVVIEHQMDVIKASDWIIDFGPEGGDRGGEIVAEGAPPQVARAERSATGKYLAGLTL